MKDYSKLTFKQLIDERSALEKVVKKAECDMESRDYCDSNANQKYKDTATVLNEIKAEIRERNKTKVGEPEIKF